MRFGLKENITKSIENILTDFPQVEAVIIYGSRAKGNYRPGSDIDLTFKGDNLNLGILNKISLQIDDLLLPYTFDLSVFNHIDNDDLLDHIEQVGKVFYQREHAALIK
jgi:predicted nucleotidyltransferase